MNKPVTVTTERVDDIPLLLAQLKRMGVQELLDELGETHLKSIDKLSVMWS